jgi:hypothetical protein
MCILYAYKLFLKFSSEYVHSNYFLYCFECCHIVVLIYRPYPVVAEVYLLCLVQQTRLYCEVLLYSLAHFIHIRFADSSVLLCRFTHLSHDTIMITIYTSFVPQQAPPPDKDASFHQRSSVGYQHSGRSPALESAESLEPKGSALDEALGGPH